MVAEAEILDDLQVGPLDTHMDMDMGRDTSPDADPRSCVSISVALVAESVLLGG